jgi:hypothetical protein
VGEFEVAIRARAKNRVTYSNAGDASGKPLLKQQHNFIEKLLSLT